MEQGADDPYQYGETPLTELEKIARRAEVGKGDVVYDLGCGTGRTSFFLNAVFGCKVQGIEIIPHFVERAEEIKGRIGNEDVNFTCADMLETDFRTATVVYFFGTCSKDEFVMALLDQMKLNLRPGARVITISYPLNEVGESSFILKEEIPVRFNWGASTAFLQVYQPLE
jgi:SAM-dependent methyltransferase